MTKTLRQFLVLGGLAATLFFVSSCGGDDDDEVGTPKPRGYFRVQLPEKKYKAYQEDCPYGFEIPDYAVVTPSRSGDAHPCWKDVHFPRFNATVHLSYVALRADSDLVHAVNYSWELVEKHDHVSSGIRDSLINRPKDNVYGIVFSVGGNAASQMQFFVTDSTHHFIRGALYFFAEPNKDSIKPILDFLEKDIFHLVETLKWTTGTVDETKRMSDADRPKQLEVAKDYPGPQPPQNVKIK